MWLIEKLSWNSQMAIVPLMSSWLCIHVVMTPECSCNNEVMATDWSCVETQTYGARLVRSHHMDSSTNKV